MVSSPITESIVRKIVGEVLYLLEEKNGQENQRCAGFVIGINEINDFTIDDCKMYTTECAFVWFKSSFKKPFIHQFKLRSWTLSFCLFVCF